MKSFFTIAAVLVTAGISQAVERVAYVERQVPKCVTGPDGVTRCTMVTETVVTTVKDAIPATSPVMTKIPAGMHAHRMKDGSIMVHGDENHGDPVAHSGVQGSNWPKIAVAGQTVAVTPSADVCPTCPQTANTASYRASVSVTSGAVFPRLTGIRARFAEWRANRVRLFGLFGGGCP